MFMTYQLGDQFDLTDDEKDEEEEEEELNWISVKKKLRGCCVSLIGTCRVLVFILLKWKLRI